MKLSEIKGERALDVIADLVEPLTEIASDEFIRNAVKENCKKAHLVKIAIKRHKKEIIEIMAALDGKEPEEYQFNLFTLPVKMLEIMNDPDVEQLFGSQEQTGDATSSTPASESTEEN